MQMHESAEQIVASKCREYVRVTYLLNVCAALAEFFSFPLVFFLPCFLAESSVTRVETPTGRINKGEQLGI